MSIFWGMAKKDRRRRGRAKTVFPALRFSRITVEIQNRKVSSTGKGFLHDLSPEGIGLFVESKMEVDDTIELVLPAPQQIRLQGRIAWCAEVPSFRILKQKKFPYRIGVEFQFTSSDDRQALELICANLAVRRIRSS